MIDPPRLNRSNIQVARSQLALEVALTAYAALAALLIVRLCFLVLAVDDRTWAGATFYRLTDPVLWPLTLLPGVDRPLFGQAALPDLTAVALMLLVPLGLAARDRSR